MTGVLLAAFLTQFVSPAFAQTDNIQPVREEYITMDAPATPFLLLQQEKALLQEVQKINANTISDTEASYRNLLGFGWGSFSQGNVVGGTLLFIADLINVTLLSLLSYSFIDAGSNPYFVAFVLIPVTVGFLLISRIIGGIMPYFSEPSS